MAKSNVCAAGMLPVLRWRGWRPRPLDLGGDEQGGQVFLVLDREGDLALLPAATISYVCYAPLGDRDAWAAHGFDPIRVSYSAASARRTVKDALAELAADGWRVVGRLQATFHGVDTEDDFWQRLDAALAEEEPA